MNILQVYLQNFDLCPVNSLVLRRASAPMPAVVGSLDAIHLATALLWQEENDDELEFLTHDRQLAIAAGACGLSVRTA
jgi:hypothetical protein